ncbi:hypothetical protein ACTXT7_015384 [Hymenolepis weldensis]
MTQNIEMLLNRLTFGSTHWKFNGPHLSLSTPLETQLTVNTGENPIGNSKNCQYLRAPRLEGHLLSLHSPCSYQPMQSPFVCTRSIVHCIHSHTYGLLLSPPLNLCPSPHKVCSPLPSSPSWTGNLQLPRCRKDRINISHKGTLINPSHRLASDFPCPPCLPSHTAHWFFSLPDLTTLPSPSSSKAVVHERHPQQKPHQRITSEKSPAHKPLIDALQPSVDKCLISDNADTDQFTQNPVNLPIEVNLWDYRSGPQISSVVRAFLPSFGVKTPASVPTDQALSQNHIANKFLLGKGTQQAYLLSKCVFFNWHCRLQVAQNPVAFPMTHQILYSEVSSSSF